MKASEILRALTCALSVLASAADANPLCSAVDCDENGVADAQDLRADPTKDLNLNGILDFCEQCASEAVYTTNSDFQQGSTSGVIIASDALSLDPSRESRLYPYVNVACSGRGTVARIDVRTGEVVGEYWTAPSGMGKNPSRTTVDHYGNVWVANRNEATDEKGSVTRIALIVGTVHHQDSTGKYYTRESNPYTGGFPWEVLDRDGDGFIRTSAGLENILDWTNDNGADTEGGVSTARDEAIVNYVRTAGTNVRTMALDADNDLWAGGFTNKIHEKISGLTGRSIPGTQVQAPCGGYGGLIDQNGLLWSAVSPWRYDPATGLGECVGIPGNYGLGMDPRNGHIWSSSTSGSLEAIEIDPDTKEILDRVPQGWPCKGIAVDCNGHVWLARANDGGQGTMVLHLKPDPLNPSKHIYAGTISGFQGTTGVCVDMYGKIWVTEYAYVSRIHPDTNEIEQRVWLGTDAGTYNYSDMAGSVAAQINTSGTWVVTHDSGRPGARWSRVSWTADVPSETGLRVFVRAIKAKVSPDGDWLEVQENGGLLPKPLVGRYVQIRAVLKGTSTGGGCGPITTTPVLYDITVWPQLGGQDCQPDGIDDACQLNFDDCNDNDTPDECETDSDTDGIIDACETDCSEDCDQNGIPDSEEISPASDQDGNGVLDVCQGCPEGRTYDVDADFGEGTSSRIVIANDQITVTVPPHAQYPYLNVACSARGTLARIDVLTGQVVGEYWTAPSGMGKNPSRTTVDHYGNVWVANRDEASDEKGSVTRIALVTGTVHHQDSTGKYYARESNPYTGGFPWEVLDRDGDDYIRTSTGLGHILPWTGAGVEGAQDEAIVNYVRTAGTNVRTLAVDGDNDLWAGGWTNQIHQKISGVTGEPMLQVTAPCGGYGGLIDQNGLLWSAKSPCWRYDPFTGEGVCMGIPGNYGLAMDPRNGHIWSSSSEPPAAEAIEIDPHTGGILQRVPQGMLAKGIAVDCNGHVWIAEAGGSRVLHLKPDPADPSQHIFAGIVAGFQETTGISVDLYGKVWATESAYVSRINPESHNVEMRVSLGPGAGLYNYSDMAGTVGAQVNATGTWTAVHNGHVPHGQWNHVSWSATTPAGTSVTVRVRAAETQAALENRPWRIATNGVPLSPPIVGRYIQVHVTLTGRSEGHACGQPGGAASLDWITLGTVGPDRDNDGTIDLCEPVRYVKADATGQNHGMSWADAYTDLHTALAETPEWGQIWAASAHDSSGVVAYTPGSTAQSTFSISRHLSVYGGFSGIEQYLHQRSVEASPTVLSGGPVPIEINHIVTVGANAAERTNVTIDGFTIRNAKGGDYGGGIRIENSDCTVRNCRLERNESGSGAGIAVLGDASVSVVNCILVANTAGLGALFVDNGSAGHVVNSTIVANHASSGAGGIQVSANSSLELANSIVWLNRTNLLATQSSQLQLEGQSSFCGAYNCIQQYSNGWYDGTLNSYPGFIRAPHPGLDGIWDDGDDLGNLRLRKGSHCIDAGNLGALPSDSNDLDSDGSRCELLPLDYAGNSRIIDDPLVAGITVDIGAYEFNPATADCNANGLNDGAEVAGGQQTDCDGNNWPDECEIGKSPVFDFDKDCDVDDSDFGFLQRCLQLNGQWVPAECFATDVNLDVRVNGEELVLFSVCADGPGLQAGGFCLDENASGLIDAAEADFDGDGLIFDNCPWVSNPEQEDEDNDGIGNACEPDSQSTPPPPDFDGDGVPDASDNCPSIPNLDQMDLDGDLTGDACDDDRDGDGLANDIDPCPDDPITSDLDGDGIHDMCDPDLDGDGILEDGDGDGNKWYATCIGGNTVSCDDNCPLDVNPDQADWDSDGFGNACDSDPGEPPGGQSLMGGDVLSMTLNGETTILGESPVPETGVLAYFVTSGGANTSVGLPAHGGTVVVDLMVASAEAVDAWEASPAVNAPDVLSIDATGWSPHAELLTWTGMSTASLPSRYNCSELYWIVASPQNLAVCQAWSGPICADRLLEVGATAVTGSYGLDAVAGPINTAASAVYTTASPLGAVTSRPIQGRAARVATLTLIVAGVPGTYQLTLSNGSVYSATTGEFSELGVGPIFEIHVGAP